MRDPYRLKFHITPPVGWMNDPNGFTKYKGEYHIFYQSYPYAPESGVKHWGHVVTKDFIQYTRLPAALVPDMDYDYQGCYSGSAVEKDGLLYLLYTGHVSDKSPKEEQCLASSEDGIVFRKFAGNPVIRHPADMEEDFRDPYVWKKDDRYYCLIGNKCEDRGRVLLYQSEDLINWQYLNVMLEGTKDDGTMWECPSYVEIGEMAVLFLSPENRRGIRHSTLYYLGRLNYETGKFQVFSEGRTDWGSEFYAPQVVNTGERKILTAWMDNWEAERKSEEYLWCGALCYPREVQIKDGELHLNPIEELRQQETIILNRKDFHLSAGENGLSQLNEVMFELELNVCHAELHSHVLKLSFREGADQEAVVLQVTDSSVSISIVEKEKSREYQIPLPIPAQGILDIRALVDMSSVELFFCEGRVNATYRFYFQEESGGFHLTSDWGIDIKELTVRRILPVEVK